jgi:hypothetical protein
MSSEHERLLAEGPRVAPEPWTAGDDGRIAPVAAPAASTAVPPATGGSGAAAPTGSRSRAALGRRLVPLLIAAALAARALGSGRSGALALGLVLVAVTATFLVRRAR